MESAPVTSTLDATASSYVPSPLLLASLDPSSSPLPSSSSIPSKIGFGTKPVTRPNSEIFPTTSDARTGYTNLQDALQQGNVAYITRVLSDLQRLRLPPTIVPSSYPYTGSGSSGTSPKKINRSTSTTNDAIPVSLTPSVDQETFQPIYTAVQQSSVDPVPLLLEALVLHYRFNNYPFIDPYPVLDTFQRLQCISYLHHFHLLVSFIPYIASWTNYRLCKQVLKESYDRYYTSPSSSSSSSSSSSIISSFSIDRTVRLYCLYNIFQRASYRDTVNFCLSTEDMDTLLPIWNDNGTIARVSDFRQWYYGSPSSEQQRLVPMDLIDCTILPTEVIPLNHFLRLESCYGSWLRLSLLKLLTTTDNNSSSNSTTTATPSFSTGTPIVQPGTPSSSPSSSVPLPIPPPSTLFFPIALLYAKLVQAGYPNLAKDIAGKDEYHRQLLVSICNTYQYPKIAYKICTEYGYNYNQFPNLYADNVRSVVSAFMYIPAPDLLVSYYYCAIFANEPLFIQNIVQSTIKRVLLTHIDKQYGRHSPFVQYVWSIFYRCIGHTCVDTILGSSSSNTNYGQTIVNGELWYSCQCPITRINDSKVYYDLLRQQQASSSLALTTKDNVRSSLASSSFSSLHPQPARLWINDGQYIAAFYPILQTIMDTAKRSRTGTANNLNTVPTVPTVDTKEYLSLPSSTLIQDLLTVEDVEKAARMVHEFAWKNRSSRSSISSSLSSSSSSAAAASIPATVSDVYIGVDAEWSAPLSNFHPHKVALVQISVYRGKYLFRKLRSEASVTSSPSTNSVPMTLTPDELVIESDESPDLVLLMDVPYLCSTVYAQGEEIQQRLNTAFQCIFAPLAWLPSIVPDASDAASILPPPVITVLTYGGFSDMYCIAEAYPWLTIFSSTYGRQKTKTFDTVGTVGTQQLPPINLIDVQALANTRIIPSRTTGDISVPLTMDNTNTGTSNDNNATKDKNNNDDNDDDDDGDEETNDGMNNDNENSSNTPADDPPSHKDNTLLPTPTVSTSTATSSSHNDPSAGGLALLVARTLGLPLNKLWQMSDWHRRPLYTAQRIYSALDAWVLPRIYLLLLTYPLRQITYDKKTAKERKLLKLQAKQQRKALRRAEAKKKQEEMEKQQQGSNGDRA